MAKGTPKQAEELVRLNKYIAEGGIASRRKADEIIAAGKVKINGKTVKELGTKVRPDDLVTIDGDPVSPVQKNIYILLNKPKDTITTASDDMGRKTVLDIVRKNMRLFPVGRLDRNTTGAILITNDGELAHRLTHPRYEIERIYNVGLNKELKLEDAKNISKGVKLEDGMTGPCEVLIYPDDKRKAMLILREGKNREVRRIFEILGYEVKKLDRKEFAGISTSGLKRGAYRHLERKEILTLRKKVGMK